MRHYNWELAGRQAAKIAMAQRGLPWAIKNSSKELDKRPWIPFVPEIRKAWLKGYRNHVRAHYAMIAEIG